MEPEQVKLFNALLEWGCAKTRAKEDFDVLAVIQRDTGNSMEKFAFDTVEKSLREAQQQIAGDSSILFYALAMLYSTEEPDEETPRTGFLIATERIGLMSSLFVFCQFRLDADSTLQINIPRECYRTDRPLLRANRESNANALRQLGLGPLLDKQSI